MSRVRLGAVGYLNARPLVYGLERSARFDLRFDVPSRCAELLHEGRTDLGLIPSIEYLHGDYRIVPDLAIASRGEVASVALYTTRPIGEARSIAMDTSSRASVALVRILCARQFAIDPLLVPHAPDLNSMLARCDAALLIGDNALFTDLKALGNLDPSSVTPQPSTVDRQPFSVEKIDLGEAWTRMTGLPFVWAFWAGRPDALTADDVRALQRARDAGVNEAEAIARDYFAGAPDRQPIGAKYLRDNIKYHFGPDERAGLELFYRYAAEAGIVPASTSLRLF